ncbi:MAG: hypothetical protein WCJ29_05700 [bacterium]
MATLGSAWRERVAAKKKAEAELEQRDLDDAMEAVTRRVSPQDTDEMVHDRTLGKEDFVEGTKPEEYSVEKLVGLARRVAERCQKEELHVFVFKQECGGGIQYKLCFLPEDPAKNEQSADRREERVVPEVEQAALIEAAVTERAKEAVERFKKGMEGTAQAIRLMTLRSYEYTRAIKPAEVVEWARVEFFPYILVGESELFGAGEIVGLLCTEHGYKLFARLDACENDYVWKLYASKSDLTK